MRPIVAATIAGVLVVAASCSGSGDPGRAEPSVTPSASSPSPTPAEAVRYAVGDCPVADGDLCAVAIDVVRAMQDADVDRLFELTRESRLVCADLATEYFPDCATDDVIRGYTFSGPDFLVDVVDGDAFRRELAAVFDAVDPSFGDELGDGAPRVIGVGTCGPDAPRRRTYHLAWTLASTGAGPVPERLLGSFEMTFEDGGWRIALWYVGPLGEWELQQPDPLELAFCEAGLTPWPNA